MKKKQSKKHINKISNLPTIDYDKNLGDILYDVDTDTPLVIQLTWHDINRIAQILDGRFDGKTKRDVELSCIFNSHIKAVHERNLNAIVEIQEQREDFWIKSRRLLYSNNLCGVCNQEFCKCG